MNLKNKTVIIIGGPTAVGKTSVAINIARHFNTEIISADSRQCYKELNIGVARPSIEELKEVKHHFIASHSILDSITAAGFEAFGLERSAELFKAHNTVVMVGGTGLYIKAFCEGLDEIPGTQPDLRQNITEQYKQNGLLWLQEQIAMLDPAFYATAEIKNPQRLMRALEIIKTTGRSVTDFRSGSKKPRDFNIIKIGLEIPKELLHERIYIRIKEMIRQGLMDEVKALIPFRHLPALNTVGYKEIFEYFDNKISQEQAIELISRNTRQYAKRQLTWFKKDKDFHWFDPGLTETIISYINKVNSN